MGQYDQGNQGKKRLKIETLLFCTIDILKVHFTQEQSIWHKGGEKEIFKGDGDSYKSFWLEIKDCCKIIDIFFISQVNNWPNEKQLEHQLKSKF